MFFLRFLFYRHIARPGPGPEHEGRHDGAHQGLDHPNGLRSRPVPHLKLLLAWLTARSGKGFVV